MTNYSYKFKVGDKVVVKDPEGFGILEQYFKNKTILTATFVGKSVGFDGFWVGLNGAKGAEWRASRFKLVRDTEYDELFI